MKKRYFMSFFAGMLALGASAQIQLNVLEDMTSKLQNADFKADNPVTNTIRTYDYDMEDDGAAMGGVGLYGQQAVTGWTAATLTDNTKVSTDNGSGARTDGLNARAAGVFAYDLEAVSEIGLGGDFFPRVDGGDTQALGMVAVWGANLMYTQTVALPAGDYAIIGKFCNVAGEGSVSNNFGYKVDDQTYYKSTRSTFPLVASLEGEGKDVWIEDTVIFRLEADATGDIVLGYSFGQGSGSAPHLFLDNVKLLKIGTSAYDQILVDEAKKELLTVITEGEKLHADTSAAQEVYDNPNATLADVQAAIENQKKINEAGSTDLSEFFIMNPHFSQDDPITDGICTYAKDMTTNNVTHSGMQPVKSWVASNPNVDGPASGVFETGSQAFLGSVGILPPATMSDGVSSGKVLGFVTCWTNTIAYTQHVTLPAGTYILTISYYNTSGANAVEKNLIGFVDDNGTEYLGTTTTFPVGKWGKEVIEFELLEETEGYFTLGYKSTNTGSANMPHFFLDGISLTYAGELEFDPSLFALQGTVRSAEEYANNVFYVNLQQEFQAAIDEANELISSQSSDAEANKAAQEKITAMLQEVMASIADYERLQKFYDEKLAPAEEKYKSHTDIHDALIALDDEIYEVLESGAWDTEEIDAAIASLSEIIKSKTQEAWDAAIASGETLEEDLDISPIFDTLGYTYSTSAVSNTSVPDKQWSYGNATNFKTQYGTAEVWNQSPFTVSQTLTEMPAGTYTITTRAFYRTADNATNYANYDPSAEMAFVFAGNNRSALTNVCAIASSEEVTGWADAGGVWVPNSQEAAYNIFNNDEYISIVSSSTRTVLTETGDLTFGITADQMEDNCWVVWYTFEIAYNAVDESVMDDELDALIKQADLALNGESLGVVYVASVATGLQNAIKNGQDAKNGTADQKKEAMAKLKEAISAEATSTKLVQQFSDLANSYSDLTGSGDENWDFASDDNELLNVISDVENTYFQNNEEVQAAIDGLPALLARYVLGRSDFNEGSIDTPINITGLIMNYSFDTNANYWTIEGSDENGRIGQNQGYQSGSYTNETDGYAIDHFIEAWRPDGAILSDGTISQTLLATLPAGFYRLECDGYATNQAEMPAEGIQGVGLYAQCGNGWDWTSMAITETTGVPQHFTRDFYADGTSDVKVGVRVASTNASWLAADNFRLYYIGQDAPDAINQVNSNGNAKAEIYTLQGVKTNAAQRGLYIIVKDGKAQKVLKK
ncbi:MAG: hypothetical protein K6A32_08525 [Bacteroidales bacterium]|nr:hypothetical protein [Bacteroidales bacterium]